MTAFGSLLFDAGPEAAAAAAMLEDVGAPAACPMLAVGSVKLSVLASMAAEEDCELSILAVGGFSRHRSSGRVSSHYVLNTISSTYN